MKGPRPRLAEKFDIKPKVTQQTDIQMQVLGWKRQETAPHEKKGTAREEKATFEEKPQIINSG